MYGPTYYNTLWFEATSTTDNNCFGIKYIFFTSYERQYPDLFVDTQIIKFGLKIKSLWYEPIWANIFQHMP